MEYYDPLYCQDAHRLASSRQSGYRKIRRSRLHYGLQEENHLTGI